MTAVVSHVLLFGLGLALAAGSLWWTLENREKTATTEFAVFLGTLLLWGGLQIGEILGGPTLAYHASFGIRATRALMAVAWFYFTMTYAGYGPRLHSRTGRLTAGLGTLFLVVFTGVPQVATVTTFEAVDYVSVPFDAVALSGTQPLRWLTQLVGYALVGIGTLALGLRLHQTRYTRRWQTAVFLTAVFAVITFDFYIERLGVAVPGVDYAAITTSAVSVVFILTLYRGDLFSFGPIARDHVFNTIDDGVIVVNPARQIVDYNDTAAAIWPTLTTDTDITTILPSKVTENLVESDTDEAVTISRSHDDGEHFYEVTVSSLENGGGEGVVVILRDVTGRERRERGLQQLHDATQDLMDAVSVDEVAAVGCETAQRVLDLPIVAVYVASDDETLTPIAWTDETERVFDGAPPALPDSHERVSTPQAAATENAPGNHSDPEGQLDAELDGALGRWFHQPIGDRGVLVAGAESTVEIDSIDEVLARVLAANAASALDRVDREAELQRQNERLNEFTGIISHDLRNPLNVAQGHLELARDECDSPHLDTAADAHDRMNTLIDDLLTLARQGDTVEAPEPVSLAETVRSAWEHVDTADATLTVDTTQTVQADPGRLTQLFENLIRNAIDHVGPDVSVTVGSTPDGFYVADDGPGIPEEHRDAVFEAGHTTAEDGTGFGLNIVEEIAEAHGWTITVTASETGGARFEITGVS